MDWIMDWIMLREKFCINIIFDSQLSLRQWEDAKNCADWVKQLYLVVLITTQQLAYMSPDIDASCWTGIKLGTPVLMVTRLSRLIAHSHKDELLLENVVLEEVFFGARETRGCKRTVLCIIWGEK
jgi:hypothetical protein